MIRAEGLTKRFGAITAVDRLAFEIPVGQVVGFLGPNGAGKTTTMRLLTAFLPPDEGKAVVMDLDVADHPLEVRRRLGYLPENNPLYDNLEVTDALHFVGRLRGLADRGPRTERVKAVVRTCGLASVVGRKTGELSKGFRQRLGLAQAIIHDPDVLVLDEPTSGLDPNQVVEVRDLIRELKKEKTLLLSTHILSEVVATCDRVIILNAGRIVADGTPDELAGNLQDKNRLYVELKGPAADILPSLERLPGAAAVRPCPKAGQAAEGFVLESEAAKDLREDVFALAASKRWPIMAMSQEKLSLEDVFRALTTGAPEEASGPRPPGAGPQGETPA
ncbi:MAG: ATP-binding cassette domain-containing protein [Elusimicrobia bacterium]|nr:ATP-binding cassette domain-containing protein [Elusimicrobiota bacterium]